MEDLASRVTTRIQITTDGHRAYAEAVEGAFGMDVDHAMLIKLYGAPTDRPDTRYSPVGATDHSRAYQRRLNDENEHPSRENRCMDIMDIKDNRSGDRRMNKFFFGRLAEAVDHYRRDYQGHEK
jgi:hypothetical protein